MAAKRKKSLRKRRRKSFRSLPDYPTEVVKLHSNLIYYFPGENVRDPGCTFHLSTSPHYYYDMEF